MAVVLATLSAIAFGVGDFLGGLSARRMAAVATALGTQVVGLVLILALSPVIGGTVTATSTEGQGTTVTLHLPAATPDQVSA